MGTADTQPRTSVRALVLALTGRFAVLVLAAAALVVGATRMHRAAERYTASLDRARATEARRAELRRANRAQLWGVPGGRVAPDEAGLRRLVSATARSGAAGGERALHAALARAVEGWLAVSRAPRAPGESPRARFDALSARVDALAPTGEALAARHLADGRRARAELAVARDEGAAVISVTDDGHGIAPAEQARIFEPFARASPPWRASPASASGSGSAAGSSRRRAARSRSRAPSASARCSASGSRAATPPRRVDGAGYGAAASRSRRSSM